MLKDMFLWGEAPPPAITWPTHAFPDIRTSEKCPREKFHGHFFSGFCCSRRTSLDFNLDEFVALREALPVISRMTSLSFSSSLLDKVLNNDILFKYTFSSGTSLLQHHQVFQQSWLLQADSCFRDFTVTLVYLCFPFIIIFKSSVIQLFLGLSSSLKQSFPEWLHQCLTRL